MNGSIEFSRKSRLKCVCKSVLQRTRTRCVQLEHNRSCRSGEALTLRWADVDFDNMLLKLHGKGAKDSLVPFSCELRRHLWRWKSLSKWDLVFPTLQGQHMGWRNELRGVKRLCKRLGIVVPARTIHAFRHTFAVNYLRRGGSVFH